MDECCKVKTTQICVGSQCGSNGHIRKSHKSVYSSFVFSSIFKLSSHAQFKMSQWASNPQPHQSLMFFEKWKTNSKEASKSQSQVSEVTENPSEAQWWCRCRCRWRWVASWICCPCLPDWCTVIKVPDIAEKWKATDPIEPGNKATILPHLLLII